MSVKAARSDDLRLLVCNVEMKLYRHNTLQHNNSKNQIFRVSLGRFLKTEFQSKVVRPSEKFSVT